MHDFWERAACGEELYLTGDDAYNHQARTRYELEPYISSFADFEATRDLRVLEIGVGLGADHERFAAAGANLSGIDLTRNAVEHTRARLERRGLTSDLRIGDAETLPFGDAQFDVVYSYGVLHHSPNTAAAVAEVHRVLKPGGIARIMIYHKRSFVGLMLWIRYGLLALKPFEPLASLYAQHLESPGTKAYSVDEARRLFAWFSEVQISTELTHGDLLTSAAGQRHTGLLLNFARKVWPRRLIRRFFPANGLHMLITAVK
ncbi:MAG: hypothetical protein JWO70_4504 [Betaproteobacteria bacterium]|nr:hypothetical protein [Betaproteobacteria bacterium]